MKVRQELTEMEAFVLRILADRPTHGFEIGRQMGEFFEHDIRPGSYYRAIHHLESLGVVAGFWETEEEAMTHQGPRRRLYRLAGDGATRLASFSAELDRKAEALRFAPDGLQT